MKYLTIILVFLFVACGKGYDFETNHGIQVSCSEHNCPLQEDIEAWTDNTIGFWIYYYPEWRRCMYSKMDGIYVFFVEEDHVTYDDKNVAGYATSKLDVWIANIAYIEVVYNHELSHIFLGECGGIWDGSHEVFADLDISQIGEINGCQKY